MENWPIYLKNLTLDLNQTTQIENNLLRENEFAGSLLAIPDRSMAPIPFKTRQIQNQVLSVASSSPDR